MGLSGRGSSSWRVCGACRRERKGSPLANIHRQLCDAMARPCIEIHRVRGDRHRTGDGGVAGGIVLTDGCWLAGGWLVPI